MPTEGATNYPGTPDDGTAWSHSPARHRCCPIGPPAFGFLTSAFISIPFSTSDAPLTADQIAYAAAWNAALTNFNAADLNGIDDLKEAAFDVVYEDDAWTARRTDAYYAQAGALRSDPDNTVPPGEYLITAGTTRRKFRFSIKLVLDSPWRAIDGPGVILRYRTVTIVDGGDPTYGAWVEFSMTISPGATTAESARITIAVPGVSETSIEVEAAAEVQQECLGD